MGLFIKHLASQFDQYNQDDDINVRIEEVLGGLPSLYIWTRSVRSREHRLYRAIIHLLHRYQDKYKFTPLSITYQTILSFV